MISVACSLVVANLSGFASSTPHVTALNAVAGYGTTFTVSDMDRYQPLVYIVDDPRGQRFTFQGYTDSNGSTSYHLNEASTQVAGIYRVQVQETQGSLSTQPTVFTIYSDEVSPVTSQFQLSKNTVRLNAYDFSLARVRVVDRFGNPLAHHFVQIVSDRANDLIKPYTAQQYATDERGEVTYAVTSQQAGTSTYTAYDTTAQVRIGSSLTVEYSVDGVAAVTGVTGDRAQVVAAATMGVGGDNTFGSSYLVAQASTDAGPAYTFSFEQLATSVKSNQPMDFTVTAYDISQKIATGYLGTVHFSALGDNKMYVSFPQDYTFLASDLGKHTFPLSLQFQQDGVYKIQVQDSVKNTLLGIATLTVGTGAAGTASTDAVVKITSPSPGSYGNNVQTISGTAPAGKDVKIYDNNAEIGTVVSSLKGQFEYTTQPLADGAHEFFVLSVDQKNVVLGTSPKVSFTINTKPPGLQNVQLVPGFSVTPLLSVQIQVTSDPHLKSIILDMNGVQSELTEDMAQPGTYKGTFASPAQPGTYPLHFLIKDALGNQNTANYDTQKFVVVPDTALSLKEVKDVKATPDSFKVSLVWNDPDNQASSVAHYRIFYGISPTQLTSTADTTDNSHKWTIPNLQNGVAYYFGVLAVDKAGTYGAAGTLVVATPNEPGGLPAADTLLGSAPTHGKTGPEVIWLFPLSFAVYRGGKKLRSKLFR